MSLKFLHILVIYYLLCTSIIHNFIYCYIYVKHKGGKESHSFTCQHEKILHAVLHVLQCDVPDGGLVPKSLYREEYQDKSPEGPPLSVDSCYNTSHVVKDFPHEVRDYPPVSSKTAHDARV